MHIGSPALRALRRIAVTWLVLEGGAWAGDPLAQARKAVAESDYVSARPALAAALQGGGRGPEELVEIYRLTGIVDAALGDANAATDAFTRLLALSPRAVLPEGTSPKIKRPFDAAGRYFTNHGALEVKTETLATPPTITLVVVSDPLHLVATARAVFTVDGATERTQDAAVGSERTALVLPAGRRFDARLAALDAHGNRLVEIGSREVPIVITSEPPPVQPLYRKWWPYAAAGGVALAATVYFGLSVQSHADELAQIRADPGHHTGSEDRAIADAGRRSVLFTNIGLGVTGAFALAAGVMYLTTPRDHVETRVAAVPLRGGGALVVGGKF